MTEESVKSWGGARAGSGRKKIIRARRLHPMTIRVDELTFELTRRLRAQGHDIVAEYSAMVRELCYDEGLMTDEEVTQYENTAN